MSTTQPTPSEPSPQAMSAALERAASQLVVALDLEQQAETSGLTVREVVTRSVGDAPTVGETPAGIALNVLDSTLRALDELGRQTGARATEAWEYCVDDEPPSPYFRLGNVETCSHRPDHPRVLR